MVFARGGPDARDAAGSAGAHIDEAVFRRGGSMLGAGHFTGAVFDSLGEPG